MLDVKQTQLHFLFIQTLCNAAHLHSRPQKNREKFEYHGVGYYTQTAQHPLYGFTLFTTETDISSLCLTLRFHSQIAGFTTSRLCFLTRFGHITVLLYKVYLKLFLKIVVLVDYLKTKLNKETETFGRIYKKA